MNFLIVNQYSSSSKYGYGGRWFYIASQLAARGHEVELVCSAAWHHRINFPEKTPLFFSYIEENLKITEVWGIKNHKSRIVQILNWFIFSFFILLLPLKRKTSPNYVINSVQPLLTWPSCWLLARFYKSVLILDVRDIWPLSLVYLANLSTNSVIFKSLQKLEKISYAGSNHIISPIPFFNDYLHENYKGKYSATWVPNGFSKTEYEKSMTDETTSIKFKSDTFNILYTGTVGPANGIDILIETIKIIKDKIRLNVFIVGSGANLEKCISLVEQYDLKGYFTFISGLSKNDTQYLQRQANCLYFFTKNTKLYEYGVSPNKLFEYFRSGKPIVFASSARISPSPKHYVGLQIKDNSPENIGRAFIEISKYDPEKLAKVYSSNLKLSESFDYKNITLQLIEHLQLNDNQWRLKS